MLKETKEARRTMIKFWGQKTREDRNKFLDQIRSSYKVFVHWDTALTGQAQEEKPDFYGNGIHKVGQIFAAG